MFFKKYKMKKQEVENLKQENEGLKAQILGLSFNLKIADEKITQYEKQIENLYSQTKELSQEIARLNTVMSVNNKNNNDSRYY
jgi:hypothetical protein